MALQLTDPDERREVLDVDLPGVVDGDRETGYTIRPIGVAEYREITKKNTVEIVDRRTFQKVPQINEEAFNDDVLDFVLVGWRGILLRGQPVPCERAHKLRLDHVRRKAITDLAGMNQIARVSEVRAESFREPA